MVTVIRTKIYRGCRMVDGDRTTMRDLHLLQERLFFLCRGLKAAGEAAINNGNGTVDARICTGAALQLEALEHDLEALIDG